MPDNIKNVTLTQKTDFTATVNKVGGRIVTTDPITVRNQIKEIRTIDDLPNVNSVSKVDGATLVWNANTSEYEIKLLTDRPVLNVSNLYLNHVYANNSLGLPGQALFTNGNTAYWDDVSGVRTFTYSPANNTVTLVTADGNTFPITISSLNNIVLQGNVIFDTIDGGLANNVLLNKRTAVPGDKPTVNSLAIGEIAINTYDGRLYTKRSYIANSNPIEAIVEFVGKVPIGNAFFVSINGSDDNDGLSWDSSYATIEKALTEATARDGLLTLIDIGPGEYFTEGHLDMPDNSMIRAVHRTVIIKPKPGFEQRNVFRMGSGCFIEGPLFEGWQLDDLDNPTEGFAVSFRPGAVITRAPYAHKIAVRTPPYWGAVAPPLDRENANPLVGVGAGVALADGAVCSPYSIFPNIMTWGATPVTHNGIGYCAKNGALINAVNAISIWCHKHFYALDGGQIILSSCSTQFGDYTMVSKGVRQIVIPTEVDQSFLSVQTAAANAVNAAKTTIINDMWNSLVSNGYTVGWNAEDEVFTKRDAGTFLQSMYWTLLTANQKPMEDFAKGLFDTQANKVYSLDKEAAFIYSFEFMRDAIKALPDVVAPADTIVDYLVAALIDTLQNTVKVNQPSVITAIGHTWTAIMAGVALTKIPPAQNFTTIEESILELDNGTVIASGQDDQGSALFIGGMKIDADTGELTGPPFEQAVNRIATRAAIARSF